MTVVEDITCLFSRKMVKLLKGCDEVVSKSEMLQTGTPSMRSSLLLLFSSESMAASAGAVSRFLHRPSCKSPVPLIHINTQRLVFCRDNYNQFSKLSDFSRIRTSTVLSKASSGNGNIVQTDENEDGVSLGTMKLPGNIDIPRFESLLFQWANSLCQGANLPLPVPLRVDKITGGARLAFITIGDGGETEALVYIDCLVYPATESLGPIFRAIRNGPRKNQEPPGEPRIMRSLLEALKKSVEIARV